MWRLSSRTNRDRERLAGFPWSLSDRMTNWRAVNDHTMILQSIAPSAADYPLLPLDRARRFAGHVVDHAVDALDLVDDARGHGAEEGHVEGIEIRGHSVGGSH